MFLHVYFGKAKAKNDVLFDYFFKMFKLCIFWGYVWMYPGRLVVIIDFQNPWVEKVKAQYKVTSSYHFTKITSTHMCPFLTPPLFKNGSQYELDVAQRCT